MAVTFVAACTAPAPSPSFPAPSLNMGPSPSTVAGAPYPTGQPGHPVLGGTSWKIVELASKPETGFAYLEIWGGKGPGHADGLAEGNCWAIGLHYSYDPAGQGLLFDVAREGDGSYTDRCAPDEQSTYANVREVLALVTAWREPQSQRLELLDAGGAIVLVGEPPPPLSTPPPGGDCGDIPPATCMDAATQAFNFGVFPPASGQTIVGWRVDDTKYTVCSSGGMEPRYDVTFVFANPHLEWTATVGELDGKLIACGLY